MKAAHIPGEWTPLPATGEKQAGSNADSAQPKTSPRMTNAGEGVGEATLSHCWWGVSWCSHCAEQNGGSSENYKQTARSPTPGHRRRQSCNLKRCIRALLCSLPLRAAGFTTTKTWKPLNVHSQMSRHRGCGACMQESITQL